MAERLNRVQNAVTIRNQVPIYNKVGGFIIVGGQDNIQAVASHMVLASRALFCANADVQ
jgi:hypothetical protein